MTPSSADRPARPSLDLIAAQNAGKAEWRRKMVDRPFKEKVRTLLALQRMLFPVIARRRTLAPWERPWPIEG